VPWRAGALAQPSARWVHAGRTCCFDRALAWSVLPTRALAFAGGEGPSAAAPWPSLLAAAALGSKAGHQAVVAPSPASSGAVARWASFVWACRTRPRRRPPRWSSCHRYHRAAAGARWPGLAESLAVAVRRPVAASFCRRHFGVMPSLVAEPRCRRALPEPPPGEHLCALAPPTRPRAVAPGRAYRRALRVAAAGRQGSAINGNAVLLLRPNACQGRRV
jgi:hypothetical protein